MTARIKDRDMYAKAGFTKPEDMPELLKKMDAEEKEIVQKERAMIEMYPQEHSGVGSVFGAIMGGVGGFTFGALSANPIVPIVGAVGGGIAGFKAGQYADRNCCPSILEDAGEGVLYIPQDRFNRVRDKIETLQEAQAQTTDPKEKRQLERAEEHFQTVKSNVILKKVVNPF